MQDASGYSALHHAALNGHQDIVELLLTHEASTNILDVKGSSPLHLAAWAGNVDIVRLLLCHGPSVPNVNLTVSIIKKKKKKGFVEKVQLSLIEKKKGGEE